MKVIITGSTGMVGEGVLLECLQNNEVSEVLSISRKSCGIINSKLKELIVPDFTKMKDFENEIKGYDACFYCAGISSVGMSEQKYHYITFDTTIAFAKVLSDANPDLVFCFVSGKSTDSTEHGKSMWARVKGKTENALQRMPFKYEYNFRPAGMLPVAGQKNSKITYELIVKMIKLFSPSSVLSLNEVGKAMIHVVNQSYPQNILEVNDIKALSR